MSLSEVQFRAIHRRLASGGFTVRPESGEPITRGISVGALGNEDKAHVARMTPDRIATYHAANTERFARGAAFGGWLKNHTAYLDTPTVHRNTPAGRTTARREVLAHKQIASYDIANDYEEFNPYHRSNRKGDIVAHDTPEQRETWAAMPQRVGRLPRTKRSQVAEGDSFS